MSATAPTAQPAAEPAHRRDARYAWAMLLARIYEVFPLRCTHCGADMRIIAFITDGPSVRDLLIHISLFSRFRSALLWRCNTVCPFRDDPTTGKSRDRRRAVAQSSTMPAR